MAPGRGERAVPARPGRPRSGSGRSTRERLLGAAYELLGEKGMSALTHRQVEDRAGASHGSTTYHFGSRAGLVEALIHDNVERDHAAMRRVAADLAADASLAGATQMTLMWAWTQRLVEALLADRHQAICRYELYLYAARRPAVQEVLRGYRNRVVAEQAAATRAAGVRHPVAAARLLLATFEGISLMNLSVPNAAQQAWAPTFLLAVSMASMNLVEPPGAPHDEAADIEAPLFEWLDPATGIVARQPDPARPPKADPV